MFQVAMIPEGCVAVRGLVSFDLFLNGAGLDVIDSILARVVGYSDVGSCRLLDFIFQNCFYRQSEMIGQQHLLSFLSAPWTK